MNKQLFFTAPGLEVQGPKPEPEPLTKVVADQFGVTPAALEVPFSRTRKREICNARYVIINLVSKIQGKGPAFTGRKVGRGHADVIHAVKRYSNYYDTEKDYRTRVNYILHLIENGSVILPEYCQS